MATEQPNDGRTVMLKGVRLSFTDSLKDAKPTVAGGVPKHTTNLIIEADSKHAADNKAKIQAAMTEACKLEFGDDKGEFWKTISQDDPKRVCYRKGERFKNQDTQEVYKGYAGNMVIAGSGPGGNKNPRRPKLFNRARKFLGELNDATNKPYFTENDILTIFYSGTYGDAKVSFYGTREGGNGVFCSIESIRSHEEGERMAGGHVQTTADEYDDLDDDGDTGSSGGSGGASSGDDFG